MTDKQLIEMFRHIKEYCTQRSCGLCKYYYPKGEEMMLPCQLKNIAMELTRRPSFWDMEKIERIINETD